MKLLSRIAQGIKNEIRRECQDARIWYSEWKRTFKEMGSDIGNFFGNKGGDLARIVFSAAAIALVAWPLYSYRHEIDDSLFHRKRPWISIEKSDCNYRNRATITINSRSGLDLSHATLCEGKRIMLSEKLEGKSDKICINEYRPHSRLYVITAEDKDGNKATRDFRILFRKADQDLRYRFP